MNKLFTPRNIILLVLIICCIGGCFKQCSNDRKVNAEAPDKIKTLPKLSTQDDVVKALNASKSALYLVVGYRFSKYECVTDPLGHLDDQFLYLNYVYSVYFEEQRDERNKITQHASWQPQGNRSYYGKVFIDGSTELEGFEDSEVEGCPTKSYNDDNHKVEYKYALPTYPFTFVAELGNRHAKLGYEGCRAIVAGNDVDSLIKATQSEASHTGRIVLLIILSVVLSFLLVTKL